MRPEHDYSHMDRDTWEKIVFEQAHHFSVFRRLGRMQKYQRDHFDFLRALKDARSNDRSLLYAITESGRSVCLDRADWDRMEADWRKRKGKPP